MPANSGIEAAVGETKVLHVHQLEPHGEAGPRTLPGQVDHSRREIDPDDLAAGRDGLGDGVGERSWAAGQIEDPLAGRWLNPLDHRGAAMGLAARHHLVEALLIGGRNAAEGAGVEVLGGSLVQIKRAGAELPPLSIISR